ncbi:hypothetical protein [Streptomyces noursei]|uniref:hypothetical protein n=1 Tax=Streptomyces noursei TaxID=1971 RepID=UPI0015E0B5C4|nr:hypothetical protein [Streptomyces noursei]
MEAELSEFVNEAELWHWKNHVMVELLLGFAWRRCTPRRMGRKMLAERKAAAG